MQEGTTHVLHEPWVRGCLTADLPIRGKVVSGFGSHDGQKNDGIDIAAEKGATVHAADGGTVVYAGNEVRGMGNLLLVSHSGGYITAYGNNEALLVKKGDGDLERARCVGAELGRAQRHQAQDRQSQGAEEKSQADRAWLASHFPRSCQGAVPPACFR